MKLYYLVALFMLPMVLSAQNTWEEQTNNKGQNVNPDSKYLVGAVPEIDGKVVFETTLEAPEKTAEQIYEILFNYMTAMLSEPNQTKQSRITVDDPEKNELCGSYQEWLVFKKSALNTDMTRFFYNLAVKCENGKAYVKLYRIFYYYDEERNPVTLKAEDTITDKYGLKKSKAKLSRVFGKFRRKTIDRKDYLFSTMAQLLQ